MIERLIGKVIQSLGGGERTTRSPAEATARESATLGLGLALCAGGLLACASALRRRPTARRRRLRRRAAAAGSADADSDPLQGFNRAMFWFNDRGARPRTSTARLAHGWIFITPQTVRTHIEQFFDNLNFPGYFVQPLLQGDPKQSGVALGALRDQHRPWASRASSIRRDHYLGLQRRPEDMGQTFGVWGIPPGPFLVLPLIAPTTTVRDFVGWPVDCVLNVGDSYFWPWFAPYGETFVRDINRRALADDELTPAREAAFDWYSAARDSYLQRREAGIRNDEGKPRKGRAMTCTRSTRAKSSRSSALARAAPARCSRRRLGARRRRRRRRQGLAADHRRRGARHPERQVARPPTRG